MLLNISEWQDKEDSAVIPCYAINTAMLNYLMIKIAYAMLCYVCMHVRYSH